MTQTGTQSGAFSVVLPTLAALLFFSALVALLTGFSLAFPGPASISLWNLNRNAYDSLHHLGWIAAVFLMTLACIAGTAAVGLILRKRWAWWIAVLLFVVNGAGDLISLIRTDEMLRFGSGAAIAMGFLILLILAPVRRGLH